MWNAVACSLALGAVVLLGQSAQAQLLEKKALSLEAARKMAAAAEAEAKRNNWRGVIAVVDELDQPVAIGQVGDQPRSLRGGDGSMLH